MLVFLQLSPDLPDHESAEELSARAVVPDGLTLGEIGTRELACEPGRVEEGLYSRPQYTAINSSTQRAPFAFSSQRNRRHSGVPIGRLLVSVGDAEGQPLREGPGCDL